MHPVFPLLPSPLLHSLSLSCLSDSSSPPLAGLVWTPCLTLNYHSIFLGIASARESRVLAEATVKIIQYESWACSFQSVKQAKGKGWESFPTPPPLPPSPLLETTLPLLGMTFILNEMRETEHQDLFPFQMKRLTILKCILNAVWQVWVVGGGEEADLPFLC